MVGEARHAAAIKVQAFDAPIVAVLAVSRLPEANAILLKLVPAHGEEEVSENSCLLFVTKGNF